MNPTLRHDEAYWVLSTLPNMYPRAQAAINTALMLLEQRPQVPTCPGDICRHYEGYGDRCAECIGSEGDCYDNFDLVSDADHAVYPLGLDFFLEVHTSDEGYDYTLYSKSLTAQDGGHLDGPYQYIWQAAQEAALLHGHNGLLIASASSDKFMDAVTLLQDIKFALPPLSVGCYSLDIWFPEFRRNHWISLYWSDDRNEIQKIGDQLVKQFGPLWLRMNDASLTSDAKQDGG